MHGWLGFLLGAIWLAALAAVGAPGAQAQLRDPGSSIREDSGGFGFLLDANYLSPRGCDRVVGFARGAPAGAGRFSGTDAFSILVDTSIRDCGRAGPRVVRDLRPINLPVSPVEVDIYFVSTSGRVLKHELIFFSP